MSSSYRVPALVFGLSLQLGWGAALGAQPTITPGRCVGDCNGSGTVVVNEIIMMVNVCFGSAPMSVCPAADANSDGRVAVNELIMAVNNALYGCGVIPPTPWPTVTPTATPSRPPPTSSPTPSSTPKPMPTAAVEPASGLVTSTLLALTTIVTGSAAEDMNASSLPGVVAGRPLRAAAVIRSVPPAAAGVLAAGGGYAAATEPCEGGGSLTGSCSENANSSTVTAVLANCRLIDLVTGSTMTGDGTFTMTIAAGGVCETGVIPENVTRITHYQNFSSTLADSHGTLIERHTSTDLTETITPTGRQGCAGADQTLAEDGSFGVVAPGVDADLSGTAERLVLQLTSSGTPCVVRIVAHGGLALIDQAGNRRFVVSSFLGTGATLIGQSDGSTLGTLDGEMITDCLGDVTFQTMSAMRLEAAPCPTAGSVAVRGADGTNGRIQFTPGGGLAFDYTADGTVERTVLTCRDPSVAECH